MTRAEADLEALEALRERDRERRADEARDEAAGRVRGETVVSAVGLDPVAASLTALRVALDATAEACGLPAGAPPAAVEWRAAQDRALAQAVMAWREVDRAEHGTPAWWDAMYRLRDAADRYAGLGIGGAS